MQRRQGPKPWTLTTMHPTFYFIAQKAQSYKTQ